MCVGVFPETTETKKTGICIYTIKDSECDDFDSTDNDSDFDGDVTNAT